MKNTSRAGFTIVELVIVIAVIAVLAAVLIPTFSGIVDKANDSKALQEAKNACAEYLIERNGIAAEFMVFESDGRFVAIHNGAAEGVYDSAQEAAKAMIADPDMSKLTATDGGKLFAYGGEPVLPNELHKELLTGKKISFMGDSISTFEGWSNNASYNSTLADNRAMYNKQGEPKYYNLVSVDETWWKKTVDELGLELCVNNSFSGSRVTRGGSDPNEVGCGDRAENLHNNNTGEMPDIIVIYMGTNDYQQIGTAVSIDEFARDYDLMIEKIKNKYPDADVYLCTLHNYDYTTAKKPKAATYYNEQIISVAERYDCNVVDFYNGTGVTPDNLESYTVDLLIKSDDDSLVHPNAIGMAKMYECVKTALARNYRIEERPKESYSVVVNTDRFAAVGEYPSLVREGGEFSVALAGKGLSVSVTVGGHPIDCYDVIGGRIFIPYVTGDIVVTAESEMMRYMNVLPDSFDKTTNLYRDDFISRAGYYNMSNKWEKRDDLIAAILPVSEGMKLRSSSFVHVSGENKGTVTTWFMEDGTHLSIASIDVYTQQTGVGYVTVPEGVVAVCMVWRNNCDEDACINNYLYIELP